jgi:hypothetical protein
MVQHVDKYIYMPGLEEMKSIASRYEAKYMYPMCGGAIDGTHIPILPPSDGYRDFTNRKMWPSYNAQLVCDDAYLIRNVFCSCPGSSHDSAVFRQSNLFKNMSQVMPTYTRTINGVDIPLHLTCDPAYPFGKHMIKVFRVQVTSHLMKIRSMFTTMQ